MAGKNILRRRIVLLLWSVLCALMHTMTFVKPSECIGLGGLDEILKNLSISFNEQSSIVTVLTLALYFVADKLLTHKNEKSKILVVISVIIGMIWLMAESYRLDNTLMNISISSGQVIKSIVYLCGSSFFIYLILVSFSQLFMKCTYYKYTSCHKALLWMYDHIFLCVFCVLIIAWSCPLILSYPANMNWDSWYQLQQFWRFSPFNTHQPIMHTLILGTFTFVGNWFGNSNVGLFMFVVAQTCVYALVVAYSFELIKKLMAPIWLMIVYIITCIFSPYYVNYANSVIKDSSYSICFLLFIIELIYALIDIEYFLRCKKHWLLSLCAIFGILTLRSNGKFILYPLFIVIFFLLVRKYWKTSPILIIKSTAIMCTPIIIMLGFNWSFEAVVSQVQKVSVVESLSLPLQQTARVALVHSEELTDEECKILDAVLQYNKLADSYDPRIADPVKEIFRKDCTSSELCKYLFTWGKMFFKYPITYIETVINQNYGLLYLRVENNVVFMDYLAEGELAELFKESIGLCEYEGFITYKQNLYDWYMLMYSGPIIGVLSHPALFILALIVVLILSIKHRRMDCIILISPLLLCIIFIILGPVFHGHPRYAFPIIYSMPVIIAYYIRQGAIPE